MKRNKAFITICVLLTFLNTSFLQAENKYGYSLQQITENELKENKLHGVSFGVWDKGKSLVRSLGVSMTNVPVTKEMHFRVGGVTINFLITVMLQLVDEKTISLDDKLSKWFPEFPMAQEVTLRMLANCTSGYYDYILTDEFNKVFNENVFKQWTSDELIVLALKEPLLFESGKGWAYSHTNFVIIGKVLEKVTGKTVEVLFRERIIQPLGLTNTIFPSTPQIPGPVLHAYSTERGVYEDSTFWNPSWTSYTGLLVSTIEDMGKWVKAFGEGALISKNSMKEMIAPTTVGLGNNTLKKYYGMGVGVINGWLVQNPKFGGYSAFMAHLPGSDLSIFVISTITNKGLPDENYSEAIARKFINKLMPNQPLQK